MFNHVLYLIPVPIILSYTGKKCINEVMINALIVSKQYVNGSHPA